MMSNRHRQQFKSTVEGSVNVLASFSSEEEEKEETEELSVFVYQDQWFTVSLKKPKRNKQTKKRSQFHNPLTCVIHGNKTRCDWTKHLKRSKLASSEQPLTRG